MTTVGNPADPGPTDLQAQPASVTTLAAAFARAVRRDPLLVAETAPALHRPVHDGDGLTDFLHRAVHAAVHWLPDIDFAGISVQFDHTPITLAGTDPAVLAVDQLPLELDDGPCLHAMRTGMILSVDAAAAATRWPGLAAGAQVHGVSSFLATPLIVDGVGRGSINLYSRDPGGFAAREADLAAVLSDYVSRGLGDYAVLRTARQQSEQMREAMLGRAPIEQAKGILMAVHQITSEAAFAMLRTQSQETNTKLRDVAATVVAAQARQPLSTEPAEPSSGALDFQSAFDHAPTGMAITDPFGVLLTVNAAMARLLGRTPETLAGTTLFDATHPDDLDAARRACADLREGTTLTAVLEIRLRDGTGVWVPATVSTAKVLAQDGTAAHLVMHVQDDTDHHVRAETVRRQGQHDPLTGLPNRALFLERLHDESARHRRTGSPLSVLSCDIDHFQAINDTYGHAGGDTVLTTLADRLHAALRPGDTAARLGGDELAVLCENTAAAPARLVATRLASLLGAPGSLEAGSVTVTVSIGAATSSPDHPLDPAALVKAADVAMYVAKSQQSA